VVFLPSYVMKRVSSSGDLRTKRGRPKRAHEAAHKHKRHRHGQEAANLVVSSSAIIANHDMMSVAAIGAAVSVIASSVSWSLWCPPWTKTMPSGGEKTAALQHGGRQQRHNCGHHAYQAQQGRTGRGHMPGVWSSVCVLRVAVGGDRIPRSRQTAPPPQSSRPDLHDAEWTTWSQKS
jgi:hypothetical protein